MTHGIRCCHRLVQKATANIHWYLSNFFYFNFLSQLWCYLCRNKPIENIYFFGIGINKSNSLNGSKSSRKANRNDLEQERCEGCNDVNCNVDGNKQNNKQIIRYFFVIFRELSLFEKHGVHVKAMKIDIMSFNRTELSFEWFFVSTSTKYAPSKRKYWVWESKRVANHRIQLNGWDRARAYLSSKKIREKLEFLMLFNFEYT